MISSHDFVSHSVPLINKLDGTQKKTTQEWTAHFNQYFKKALWKSCKTIWHSCLHDTVRFKVQKKVPFRSSHTHRKRKLPRHSTHTDQQFHLSGYPLYCRHRYIILVYKSVPLLLQGHSPSVYNGLWHYFYKGTVPQFTINCAIISTLAVPQCTMDCAIISTRAVPQCTKTVPLFLQWHSPSVYNILCYYFYNGTVPQCTIDCAVISTIAQSLSVQ